MSGNEDGASELGQSKMVEIWLKEFMVRQQEVNEVNYGGNSVTADNYDKKLLTRSTRRISGSGMMTQCPMIDRDRESWRREREGAGFANSEDCEENKVIYC